MIILDNFQRSAVCALEVSPFHFGVVFFLILMLGDFLILMLTKLSDPHLIIMGKEGSGVRHLGY